MAPEADCRFQNSEGLVKAKRRKLHGACDVCRHRKIRCDAAAKPGQKCSNCVSSGTECTHHYIAQKKGQAFRYPQDTTQHGKALAELQQSMDPLLKTILSGPYQAPANPMLVREVIMDLARYARTLEAALANGDDKNAPIPSLPLSESLLSTSEALSGSISPEDSALKSHHKPQDSPSGDPAENAATACTLANTLKRSLVLNNPTERFFGPSSNVALVDTTALEFEGVSCRFLTQEPTIRSVKQHMRPEFWTVYPWEQPTPPENRPYDFPPPDLLGHLVQLYFDCVNIYAPLLHRPTFERSLKAKHHLSDPDFGGVVMAVCAVAARYSNDDRVLLEGNTSYHSSGFKWFRQIRLFQESFRRAPSLYELQVLCLAMAFLSATSIADRGWYLVGFGIRAAQDIGLNKKRDGSKPTAEGELRKRVFWMLLLMDSMITACNGRPAAINASDFDVEMPIDCDDEYWDHPDPELAFKQPPGVPSKVSYFCLLLKLFEIHCSSHRAFYSVKRPDPPPGISAIEWDRTTLASLDSALNAWADTVPEYLRWDPNRLEGQFLNQSAKLYTTYYATQILAHRQFTMYKTHRNLAMSSLAICINAARACIRIMDTQSRMSEVLAPHAHHSLFSAGLMLILNVWRARDAGHALVDERRDIETVFTCIKVIKTYEDRWHGAGRHCDILMALVSVGRLSPESAPATRPKRHCDTVERETDSSYNVDVPQSVFTQASQPGTTSSESAGESSSFTHALQDNAGSVQVPFGAYGSDLSGTFARLNQLELDQAMSSYSRDQTASSSGGAPLPAGTPLNTNPSSSQDTFFNQLFATGSSTFNSSSPAWPADGSVPGVQPPSLSTYYLPTQESVQGPGSDVLDNQGAALWTGMPMGYDIDDWGRYLSEVELLNSSQQYSSSFQDSDIFSFES